MSLSLRSVFAVLTVALVAGCAGTDFKRPETQSIVVGKSAAADVTRLMGTPRQVGESLVNGQKVKTMSYAYALTTGEPRYPGVLPARAMVFQAFNGIVVGQEFVSSFKQDATDFDDAKVPAIVKGRTTRAQVVAMLGQPTGEVVYPLIKEKDQKGVVYSYGQAKGTVFNMKFHNKKLLVSFTPADVVADVEYTSSGEK
jgi:outer membrane protein assembly factor BamE (lipoprotein component of BamABCDE complex)